jgi:hypothetical protein
MIDASAMSDPWGGSMGTKRIREDKRGGWNIEANKLAMNGDRPCQSIDELDALIFELHLDDLLNDQGGSSTIESRRTLPVTGRHMPLLCPASGKLHQVRWPSNSGEQSPKAHTLADKSLRFHIREGRDRVVAARSRAHR